MNLWLLITALALLGQPAPPARHRLTQERGPGLPAAGAVTKVNTRPAGGFFWDYYVYVPRSLSERPDGPRKNHILVVPNNTGRDDDDMRAFFRKAMGS